MIYILTQFRISSFICINLDPNKNFHADPT